MANSNLKTENNSVSTFGFMHKVLHNFSDWEIETCHMTRIERSIYFDMRTLYLKLGKPLTDDMELLTRRLRCTNQEELTALEFLLKDKFRHDKKTKTYRQSEWDLILKNYKFRHKANNDETQCEQNDEMQNSNAERLKSYRERNKKIISSLNGIGVKANSRMTSKQLQALCEQHNIVVDDEMPNNDETQCEHDEQKNEPINQAITNNHKPITINQDKKQKLLESVTEVFEFWKSVFDKNDQTKLSETRKRKIEQRLAEGYTVEQIKQAISNCSKSDYHVTGNHIDLELICRSIEKMDYFLGLKQKTPKTQATQYGGANDPLAVNHKFRPNDTGMVAPNTIFETDENGNFVARPIEPAQQPTVEAW